MGRQTSELDAVVEPLVLAAAKVLAAHTFPLRLPIEAFVLTLLVGRRGAAVQGIVLAIERTGLFSTARKGIPNTLRCQQRHSSAQPERKPIHLLQYAGLFHG
jgi:hypothetical protein